MKLTNPLRSKFLSANATLGVPTLVRLMVGLAKSKTSAVLLGPAGVGIVGVGTQLQGLGASCVSLGSSSGFIRVMSGCLARGDQKNKRDLLGTSFTLQCLVNTPMFVVAMVFVRPFARWVFGNDDSYHYLIPILITIPLQSVMVSHLGSVFYAHGKLNPLARASVISALVEAVTYIGLVRVVGVAGAFWGVTIGMAAWFGILAYLATRLEPLSDLFHFKLRQDYLKELVTTGAIMTFTGIVTYLANTLIRIKIAKSLGDSFAGHYQVVMALTAYYIPYFTNGVWGRLFPKVSREGLNSESRYEWGEAIILTAILSAGVQIVLMAVARPLISIFYSHDFSAAVPLTSIQFLGDLFYLVSIPTLGVILGLDRMRLYLITWTAYYVAYYVLATILVNHTGLQGTIVAYLACNIGLAAFSMGFFIHKMRASSQLRPAILTLVISAAAVGLQAWFCHRGSPIAVQCLLPLLWSTLATTVLFSPRIKSLLHIHASSEASSGSRPLPVAELAAP